MQPIMYARGAWELLAPWTVVAGVSYKCDAIRSFVNVQAEGIDIFKAYYEPKGLAQAVYDTDRVNGVSLVTLVSDEYPEIIVPTSYITKAPTTVSSGFSRMVLGVDIGVLPDTLDISYLNAEIVGLVSSLTGLEAEVTTYVAPMTGTLTPEQAEAFEDNRKAAITNRTTYYSKVATLTAQLATVTALKDRYEKLIVAAGIVSSS